MLADQILVSTGQELQTMKLQTYPTNSPCCFTQNYNVGAYNENIHIHSVGWDRSRKDKLKNVHLLKISLLVHIVGL